MEKADFPALKRALDLRGSGMHWYERNGSVALSASHSASISFSGQEHFPETLLALGEVVDFSPRAVIVARRDGQVVLCNSAARALVQDGRILAISEGRLEIASVEAAELSLALAAAADPVAPRQTTVMVRRDSGPDYLFILLPLLREPGCLALFGQELPPPDRQLPRRLQNLFGLTPAEAEIAIGIADGSTVREIAAERQVSGETIRVQLKSLTRKLGCRRQAEVASMVRAIFPIRDADPPA